MKIEPFGNIHQLGESPIWDHRSGELVWVDVPAGQLWTSTERGPARLLLQADQQVTAVDPAGRFWVGSMAAAGGLLGSSAEEPPLAGRVFAVSDVGRGRREVSARLDAPMQHRREDDSQ